MTKKRRLDIPFMYSYITRIPAFSTCAQENGRWQSRRLQERPSVKTEHDMHFTIVQREFIMTLYVTCCSEVFRTALLHGDLL